MSIDLLQMNKLIEGVKAVCAPRKIILFGSAARGDMGPNSDIDVLVVVADGTHRRETAQAIYRALYDRKLEFAVDVVVATEMDLLEHKDDFWTVICPALREGKTVYAA